MSRELRESAVTRVGAAGPALGTSMGSGPFYVYFLSGKVLTGHFYLYFVSEISILVPLTAEINMGIMGNPALVGNQ